MVNGAEPPSKIKKPKKKSYYVPKTETPYNKVKGYISKDLRKKLEEAETLYSCKHCSRKFVKKDTLRCHVEQFHKVKYAIRTDLICICNKCKIESKTMFDHEKHMFEVHEKKFCTIPECCGLPFENFEEFWGHNHTTRTGVTRKTGKRTVN